MKYLVKDNSELQPLCFFRGCDGKGCTGYNQPVEPEVPLDPNGKIAGFCGAKL